MKKRRVTYGINGYMAYEAIFMSGKTKHKVTFSDGSITATGKRPATFTTDSLLLQHVIESSPEFKKGFIFKYRSLMLNEDVVIERNPVREKEEHPGCKGKGHCNPKDESGSKLTAEVEEADTETGLPSDAGQEKDPKEEDLEEEEDLLDDVEVEQNPQEVEVEASVKEMVFTSNDEAKDYLAANYGVVTNALKNRNEIIRAGEANGVKIVFAKP